MRFPLLIGFLFRCISSLFSLFPLRSLFMCVIRPSLLFNTALALFFLMSSFLSPSQFSCTHFLSIEQLPCWLTFNEPSSLQVKRRLEHAKAHPASRASFISLSICTVRKGSACRVAKAWSACSTLVVLSRITRQNSMV